MLFTIIVLSISSSGALAVPGEPPLGHFVEYVRKINPELTDERIREEIVDVLRATRRYSNDDLRLIGKGDPKNEFTRMQESMMVETIQNSLRFQVNMGIDAIRRGDIASDAAAGMEQILADHARVKRIQAYHRELEIEATHLQIARMKVKAYTASNVGTDAKAVTQSLLDIKEATNRYVEIAQNLLTELRIPYKHERGTMGFDYAVIPDNPVTFWFRELILAQPAVLKLKVPANATLRVFGGSLKTRYDRQFRTLDIGLDLLRLVH